MSRDPWSLLHQKDDILRKLLDGIAVCASPDVIADVGCFNGDEIARLHSLCPEADCHAFEANERNLTNYIAPRQDIIGVTLNHLAVADYDGQIEFTILDVEGEADDWRRGAGSLNKRTDGMGGTTVTVACTRLDTYFEQQLRDNCTFLLWIDVEGALDRVIAGGQKVLRRTIALRAEVERFEFWEGQTLADEILAKFDALGFILLADSFTPAAFEQSDVIFLNRDWLALASGDNAGTATKQG